MDEDPILRVEKKYTRIYTPPSVIRVQRFIYVTPEQLASGQAAILVNEAVQRWTAWRPAILLNGGN